jgi:C_GCAxxG_C_C family probable redox protein
MTPAEARARARELFLDEANVYGCAETVFIVLKEAFELPAADDASAAMALNGGLAYSGGACGAITGAALAVGQLAARQSDDHQAAKSAARQVIAGLMADFTSCFGSTACRDLTGVDLDTEAGHRQFIESGAWRDGCMRQIEWVVGRLAPLAGQGEWEMAVSRD